MRKIYYIIFFCILNFACAQTSFATHIKAADIKVVRDSTNAKRYQFTLFVYYDESKVGTGGVPTEEATLDFGDKNKATVTRALPLQKVSPGVVKGTYIFTHTYALVGNYYIGYAEANRVDGVLNMSNSVNTQLYIETMISIQPFAGLNDSPVLTIPPIDNANSGQLYTYNAGAYDPNGDSLAFEIIPTQQRVGKNVDGYVSPADPKFNGTSIGGAAATFTINPKTGDITWDTPGQQGIYNIAIKVKEYRNGREIGYVVRDMQIVVKDGKNKPPKLALPNDTCLVANGSKLILNIQTTDPDGNDVLTDAFGSEIDNKNASFASATRQSSIPFALTQITWSPTCGDARDQPYQFNLVAEDFPPAAAGSKLYDFKTISVKLNAPKPSNFKVASVGKAVKLTWDPYFKTCNTAKFKDTIRAVVEIYRQECDSIFDNNDCNLGRSTGLNATLIATVKITDSVFVDDNNGKGLKIGTYYFYTIKPRSNDKSIGGGSAIAATPQGIILSPNTPLIKSISTISTGQNGQIKISWSIPTDTSNLTPPYNYKLTRSAGLNSNNYIEVANIFSNHLLDSFYVDNANTQDSTYMYQLKFYANGIEIGTTDPASSVYAISKASNASINIQSKYKQNFVVDHFNIYNAKSGVFVKSVKPLADSLVAFDINNLQNCDTSCYIIESVGKYCLDTGDDSLVNRSQIVCGVPKLGSKPVVRIGIKESICANFSCEVPFPDAPYANTIFWRKPFTSVCDQPKGYNIYYSENDKAAYNKIGTTSDTSFVHSNMKNFAGCYLVKTINFNDEESEASNIVCQDICPCFELPNIITPNDDQLNDLFTPLFPPRFVDEVKFTVFNRWGGKVYESTDITDINIHWNSKNLSDGIYYYHAEVKFSNRAKESDRNKTYKGWVQVAR